MKAILQTFTIENGNFAPVIPKEAEAEATSVRPDYHCGYTVYMRKPKKE